MGRGGQPWGTDGHHNKVWPMGRGGLNYDSNQRCTASPIIGESKITTTGNSMQITNSKNWLMVIRPQLESSTIHHRTLNTGKTVPNSTRQDFHQTLIFVFERSYNSTIHDYLLRFLFHHFGQLARNLFRFHFHRLYFRLITHAELKPMIFR